jgi:hypothetical protein
LGSDIVMAFDECPALPASRDRNGDEHGAFDALGQAQLARGFDAGRNVRGMRCSASSKAGWKKTCAAISAQTS